MSDNIRSGLESHLNSLIDHIDIEYEGVSYTPTSGTPYQSCYMLRSETDDLSLAFDERRRFNGIFQITLRYPSGQGSGAMETEALRVMDHFKRSTIIDKDTTQIRILQSPTMKNLGVEDDRLLSAVRIVYEAYNIV